MKGGGGVRDVVTKCDGGGGGFDGSVTSQINFYYIQKNQIKCARTRLKRLATIRQRDIIVVWSSRLNAEHVDWFDKGDEEIS